MDRTCNLPVFSQPALPPELQEVEQHVMRISKGNTHYMLCLNPEDLGAKPIGQPLDRPGTGQSLTCGFHLGEEGAHFLPVHDVRDDVARHFGVSAVGDDHRRAALQGPQGSFHLAGQ